ncbi:MAG: DUF2157 domain-containing protein [Candidatus Hydrogenedentes bacterium]|nr:DUF2157 domain-containing protein [Candidatus Hydrogenedentota bacterium]
MKEVAVSKKGIRWLYGELPDLVSRGLLTEDAAQRLRDHYGNPEEERRLPIALIVCSVLGATLVALGIILMLAHNWEFMSRGVRTFVAFAPLLTGQALAAYAIARKSCSPVWAESTGAFLALSIGACIALIGQTYQIPGDLGAFLLTWALLGLPLVYLLNASVPAVLYMAGMTGWAIYRESTNDPSEWYWLLLLLVVPHITIAYREDRFGLRSTWLTWAFCATLCVATGFVLERSLPGLWIVVYSSLFTSIYLGGVVWAGPAKAFWRRPLRTIGGVGICVMALLLSFEWPWHEVGWYHYHSGIESETLGLVHDLAVLALYTVVAVVLLVKVLGSANRLPAVLGVTPIVATLGYVMASAYELETPPMLLYNGYLLALGVGVTALGLQLGRLGTLNAGLAIMAAWITARFFDSDMDFVTRGIVFILLGAGFLGANLAMLRRRRTA